MESIVQPYSILLLIKDLYTFRRRFGHAPHHIPRRERIINNNLLHLFFRNSICFVAVNLESNMTPRNLCEGEDLMTSPLILSENDKGSTLFLENTMRADFEGDTSKPRSFKKLVRLFTESSKTLGERSILEDRMKMAMSSAYWMILHFLEIEFLHLATYMLKRRGLKIEPWGTPL